MTKNHEYVSLATLDAAIVMLKNIGREDDAKALLKSFESSQDAEFRQPERDPFGRSIGDSDAQII
ncbi:hypothetical protein [Tardiphaga sp.]|uniref:hypothetical protein n=1 Tax=Tardiphaga sp. TaxID=1926292 RepID=UPI002617D906|nr:hypothetical protein [Tardiphaga sp.]